MDEQGLTLRNVLFPSHSGMPEDVWSYVEASQPVVRLRERLSSLSPGFEWAPEAQRIAGKILGLLDVNLVHGVLLKGWNEGKLFRKYLDPQSYDPKETVEVALVDHALRSTHRPRVELVLNGIPLDPIELEVVVVVQVKGAVLEIRDGRILRLRTGELSGKAELKVGGFLLVSERFQGVRLPGVRELDDGGAPIEA